ncbi:DUF2651 family protein [Alkalicoccobacillus gibsonii]|uniref:DUF2651 family protein n=1 Tax=Alkalicoccobacillus gibsonii TaxID=79881 RepID=UPI0035174CAD
MENVDPFLMQLYIVPLVVIGIGVLVSILLKMMWVAPVVTLLLNLLYEIWYSRYYYPGSDIGFTSWNVIFPLFSLAISVVIILCWPRKAQED